MIGDGRKLKTDHIACLVAGQDKWPRNYESFLQPFLKEQVMNHDQSHYEMIHFL